jgi:putative endonuclease
MPAVATGSKLEEIAVEYLQEFGIMILHRNFLCKFGEIDIIGQHNSDLIFFEVRYRQYNSFGNAAESVTLEKQNKIILAAEFFIQSRNWAQKLNARFDVIAMSKSIDAPEIEWIKDAFNA